MSDEKPDSKDETKKDKNRHLEVVVLITAVINLLRAGIELIKSLLK